MADKPKSRGQEIVDQNFYAFPPPMQEALVGFFNMVIEEEREACAIVAENCDSIVAADVIRARSHPPVPAP